MPERADALRSLEWGIGGPALKDAFGFEEVVLPGPSDQIPRGCRQAACLFVFGCWFLMREIEIAALRDKRLTVDLVCKEVSLTLAASKCDQQGNLVQRKHGCYCDHVPASMCPFHNAAAFDFLQSGRKTFQAGDHCHHTQNPVQEFSCNAAITCSGTHAPLERFGGHALRHSGAQFFAMRLVPLPTIMLLGHWGSRSVKRYVQEAALETFSLDQGVKFTSSKSEAQQSLGQAGPSDMASKPLAELAEKFAALAARVGACGGIAEPATSSAGEEGSCSRKLPVTWKTVCRLWKYGCAAFTRASEASAAMRCRRCFPESTVNIDIEEGEVDSVGDFVRVRI